MEVLVWAVLTTTEQAAFREFSGLHRDDEPDEHGVFARPEPPRSTVRLVYVAT